MIEDYLLNSIQEELKEELLNLNDLWLWQDQDLKTSKIKSPRSFSCSIKFGTQRKWK